MYGKNIKNARIIKGKTQTIVAKSTGLPQNTISWIELDKGIPNIQQCIILADYYKISLDELVGRADEDGIIVINDSEDSYTADEKELIEQYQKLPQDEKYLLKGYLTRLIEEKNTSTTKNIS